MSSSEMVGVFELNPLILERIKEKGERDGLKRRIKTYDSFNFVYIIYLFSTIFTFYMENVTLQEEIRFFKVLYSYKERLTYSKMKLFLWSIFIKFLFAIYIVRFRFSMYRCLHSLVTFTQEKFRNTFLIFARPLHTTWIFIAPSFQDVAIPRCYNLRHKINACCETPASYQQEFTARW